MAVTVQRQFFRSRDDVLEDIRKSGTWPTTFVSGPSEGLDVHWHSEDVHAYVMEGETDFFDAENDKRIAVGPGDKIIVPARALHAEGAVEGRVVYILALPAPLPPEEFLKMHAPMEL